jgi:hypothetical protein
MGTKSLVGRENPYTCKVCGGVTNTIHVDHGVTPFMLDCRATPGCKGMAVSSMYPMFERPAHIPEPTWEWYRPGPSQHLRVWEARHVAQGGALIRPLSPDTRARFPGSFRKGPPAA